MLRGNSIQVRMKRSIGSILIVLDEEEKGQHDVSMAELKECFLKVMENRYVMVR